MTLRLQNKEDVFLLIQLRTPPLGTSFPAPGYISSQKESQWNVHLFQGEFHCNLQGCPWPRALPKTPDTPFSRETLAKPLSSTQFPVSFLPRGRGSPGLSILPAPLSSALQPQTCFFRRKTQNPEETTTCRNSTVYIPGQERDISFINTASLSFPTLSPGLTEPGHTGVLTTHLWMRWPSRVAGRTAGIASWEWEGEKAFTKGSWTVYLNG